MKQFTTPTIKVTIKNGEPVLTAADEIICTISDGVIDIDIADVEVLGDTLLITLTEEQTGQLAIGNLMLEVTIRIGEKILKTKTMKMKLIEAVRDSLLGGETNGS